MTIGVALNTVDTGNAVDDVVEQARDASTAGVGSVWFGQRFDYDAITLAGIVGREVPDLKVGTSAVPIFARHPLTVLSQAQTVQAATQGRFQLGLALGAPQLVEGSFGIPYERPVELAREFLQVARSLVETGTADHHGELLTAAPKYPTTVAGAGTDLPLLVAAMGPRALRASGELADGILPFLAGPRVLENSIVPQVQKAAADAGRPPVRVIAFIAAIVTDDVDAGRAAAEEATSLYDTIPSYQRVIADEGHERAADLVLIGSAAEVRAGVQRYYDAGATEVVLTQSGLLGRETQRETWAAVAR
ncbi:TIGR03564 family F420-dependent LLM class oxidoreductase [Rhodococcoides kyotonense]|uniref:F420-dependent oxidoreductase, MSMEG_4879 family n=1 Tax=Rhodococcoides kyotonense TaxID=398843 RepID=A0A239NCR1_9NOCA|nr:TIGR03564 family F420-dependent LLM class oxidoreductase [Rhodococcus kyotonensis]SNT51959.1 F420-dependent oxidoreductase, MSMEG_4879 family [Rhodococcus kyotonensis]